MPVGDIPSGYCIFLPKSVQLIVSLCLNFPCSTLFFNLKSLKADEFLLTVASVFAPPSRKEKYGKSNRDLAFYFSLYIYKFKKNSISIKAQ